MLDLDNIRIDGGTQSRLELVESVVSEYADHLAAGESLPPVITFFDGVDHWLADGFHRFFAHKKLGLLEVAADIREGTKRDAILFSVGANGKHGLRRTNADKRKAVETLLKDAEWTKWSDNAIAKACGVSDKTVAAHRTSIFGISEDAKPSMRTVERNGKTYEQKVSSIGKVKPEAPAEEHAAAIAKPLPVSKPDPLELVIDDGPDEAEMAALIAAQKADAELVQGMLDADDALTYVTNELAKTRAQLEAVTASRNGYQNQCAELINMVKAKDRLIAKLKQVQA